MSSHSAGLGKLVELAGGLTPESAAEKHPNCFPLSNPLDLLRARLTDILVSVTGVDAKIVYPALQWTTSLDKGDLVLAIPALRLKGKKPDELAKEFSEKVQPGAVPSRAAGS